MSDYVLVGLCGIALSLPIGIAAMALLVSQHIKGRSPLWTKIVFPLLYVLSIGPHVGFGAYGSDRFDAVTDQYFGIIYFLAAFAAFCISMWLFIEAYEQ
ncbi:MAG: hypothetical protein WA843_00905 [Candidatus Saccharimonadales bacterium]